MAIPRYATLHAVKTEIESMEMSIKVNKSYCLYISPKFNVSRCGEIEIRYLGVDIIFTARRYAERGFSHRKSVCLSVRPSGTLMDCVHMV